MVDVAIPDGQSPYPVGADTVGLFARFFIPAQTVVQAAVADGDIPDVADGHDVPAAVFKFASVYEQMAAVDIGHGRGAIESVKNDTVDFDVVAVDAQGFLGIADFHMVAVRGADDGGFEPRTGGDVVQGPGVHAAFQDQRVALVQTAERLCNAFEGTAF